MNINIVTKNYDAGERLKGLIDKKFAKLDKYFSKDMTATVTITDTKGKVKMEATLPIKDMFFRAEATAPDAYTALDVVVEKLSTQMSRFKTKLQRRFKDTKEYAFEELPESAVPEPGEEQLIRRKHFVLTPMNVDEAIMQMELLEHNFYVFLNMETDSTDVVYKRADGTYGLLETAK